MKPRAVKEVQLTPQPARTGGCEGMDSKRVKKDPKMAANKPDFSLNKKLLEVTSVAKSVSCLFVCAYCTILVDF